MNTALRRAAILIASLDTASADALLDEMSPEQAALVRSAVMDLGEIQPNEQQQVIAQFVQQNPKGSAVPTAGVEVDPDLARKFNPPPTDTRSPADDEHRPTRSFAFLDAVDADQLAQVLAAEHPQTTAIVVAHLEPARAAEVLSHLPPARQSEALMRIARLTAPHPDIIRDLEHEMQSRLAHRGQRDQVAEEGLASVEAILRYASPHQRQGLVAELSQHDRVLVRRLRVRVPAHPSDAVSPATSTDDAGSGGYRSGSDHGCQTSPAGPHHTDIVAPHRTSLRFPELENLDNAALAQILRRSSPNTTLLALAGASHDFVQKILAQLPPREASQLDRKIQHIGPLRLDDVQRAQQQLADIAQQLIDEGRIVLPGQPRFAVAA